MTQKTRIFSGMRGGMLVELMMSVALAALIIPFLFRYQHDAVTRTQNIVIANQMADIQDALERYIIANRDDILKTVGRSITRVDMATLAEYGIPDTVAENADKYQLRVLKSSDVNGQSTLQGVIVFTDTDITPMRTREIVALGGNSLGFIEGPKAYGTFGAWRADTVDLGVAATDGIVGTTTISRDNAQYLWRVPSENMADATMMAPLNLGGHNISNASFMNASNASFDETLHITQSVANTIVFQNRTSIDTNFDTRSATCAGVLSSDSKNMEVTGTLTLADLGRFNSFSAFDLWATNMRLAGLTIWDTVNPAVLEINQTLDMTAGRIDAIYATVSFTGSITPRIQVSQRIEDSINPAYFWDVSNSYNAFAHLADVKFMELNDMAQTIYASQNASAKSTEAARIFGAVTANRNATISAYINAIKEIQSAVRAKYSQLNLE